MMTVVPAPGSEKTLLTVPSKIENTAAPSSVVMSIPFDSIVRFKVG